MSKRKLKRLLRKLVIRFVRKVGDLVSAVLMFVWKNLPWILLGVWLTKLSVEYAYEWRGYQAVGGEWLVLPALLMVVHFFRTGIWELVEVFSITEYPWLEDEEYED